MEEFYKASNGLTLMVIKHNGDTFDFVNGPKGMTYFKSWNLLRFFMNEGGYYVVFCLVLPSAKAKFLPIGIAFECADVEEAKEVSFAHRRDVEEGKWKPQEQIIQLMDDWQKYRDDFIASKIHQMDMYQKSQIFAFAWRK